MQCFSAAFFAAFSCLPFFCLLHSFCLSLILLFSATLKSIALNFCLIIPNTYFTLLACWSAENYSKILANSQIRVLYPFGDWGSMCTCHFGDCLFYHVLGENTWKLSRHTAWIRAFFTYISWDDSPCILTIFCSVARIKSFHSSEVRGQE